MLCSSFWADPTVGTQVKTAVAGFINDAENAARKEGVLQNFKYPNYAAADFQNPLKSNGVRDWLRVVALKYDCTGLFRRQVVGGWKLY